MMRTVAFLPLLLVAPASAAPGVVARVDGVAITSAELRYRLAASPSKGPPRADDVLEDLVAEALLAAEGRRLGLAGKPEIELRVQQDLRAAASSAMLDEIVEDARIDDASLRQMFHATADFASFDLLVYATRDDAQSALGRLAKGSDWAPEASRAIFQALNPSPADAPPHMRAEMDPGLSPALFQADPGQVVGPVGLRNGWGIARLIRKEIGEEGEFAARRPALVRHAKQQLRAEARRHVAEQLRAKSPARVDEDFLKAVGSGPPTVQQLDHVLATVGERPIRYRDIYASVRALAAGSGHMSSPGVRISLAWQAVEDRLLEEAAVQRGLTRKPAVTALEPSFRRRALATVTADGIRTSAAAPSEQEIKAHYDRNAAALGRPFAEVLPIVARGAAAEKREAALSARLAELRGQAKISIDRAALESLAEVLTR